MDSNPLFATKTVAMHNFIDKVEWKETEKKGYKKIEENYNDTVGKKRTVYAAKNMIKTHIPDKLRVQIYRMKFLRELLSGE